MEPAETTVPASDDSTLTPAETPREYRSKESLVEDILRGVQPDPAVAPPETVGTAEPEAETPLDIGAIAERLGVDPAKLYDARIPLADGAEPVTLGQLKDAYRDAQALEAARSEVTKARGEWQADQLRQQRELDEILSAIRQDAIDPQLAQAVQKVNRERLSREAEALFRTVPEWTDQKTRDADLVQMVDTLTPYGITRADLDAVTDHRVLRAFRRLAHLERAVKVTTAPKTPPKSAQAPKKAAQPTPGQEFGRLKAAVTQGRVSRVEAVNRILGVK